MKSNEEILQDLKQLSDNKYKEFHTGLCPGTENIIGVRVPVLRKYAKEIAKEQWKEYLENAKNDYYEEILLQGMVIGSAKMSIEQMKQELHKFIPKIDNWAVCDITVAGLKQTKNNLREMWDFIQEYLRTNKEFEIRFAVVMLLDFYIIDEYIDKVLEILNNIKHEGYYVKMAVAWAISIAYIKYPQKTMKLLKNNQLDDFTYNKSLQKITESYRIEKDIKEEIRKMKRK